MTKLLPFRNPIIPGFNPDPSIVRVSDDYFLVTSSFELFPGVPLYHSKDLVNWSLIGHCLTRSSQLNLRNDKSSHGIYAATIREHEGRFYVTTVSMGDRGEFGHGGRGFYVWTDNIWDENTWSEPIFFDMLGIDQDLFWDPKDEKCYLTSTWGREDLYNTGYTIGCWTVEVDLATGRSLQPITHARHSAQLSKYGKMIAEGAHIYFKDGWYYLLTAEGGTETNHQEWVSRSRVGPLGPWEEGPDHVNPMIHNSPLGEVTCTGHMDLVEGVDGQWWAVFLGRRDHQQPFIGSQLGRETFIAPVEWINDWPIVNNREPIGINGSGRLPRSTQSDRWEDRFQKDLQKGWYHLRTPQKRDWEITPRGLILFGGPVGIRSWESPTMLLRKQTAFTGVWTTELEFDPSRPGEEAGTILWRNEYAFGAVAIRGVRTEEGLKRALVYRFFESDSDDEKESVADLHHSESVKLRIETTEREYTFSYALPDSPNFTTLGSMAAQLFWRERRGPPFHKVLDSPFTGTHLGVYCEGPLAESCNSPACFRSVEWTGTKQGGP